MAAVRVPGQESWNFLRGEGPSSQDNYYAEEKKAFKPGWRSRRPADQIQPDTERKQQEQRKEQRDATCSQLRTERLHNQVNRSHFNVVTGQESKPDGSWAAATDPWQHQRLGLRPAAPGGGGGGASAAAAGRGPAGSSSSSSSAMHSSPMPGVSAASAAAPAAAGAYEMRKNRMAQEGLVTTKRTGGTVKELLSWQG